MMLKRSLLLLVVVGCLFAQDMVVRVYARSWRDLKRISTENDLDISGARAGQYYDLVVDGEGLNRVIASGLPYEVVVYDLALAKESVRADYLSYTEIEDSLRQLALDFPSICKFDSLPIPTYEGNWIYGIKISDSPNLEENDEPGFLIDGTHHAREWACVPVIMFFADSILSAYGSVPEITEIIDNNEIYCFPVINVDGYIYDYNPPVGSWWRKNREPFGGSIGTDANRNYAGCSPDIEGDWGAVDEGQASHQPSYTLFCGAYANSGDETRALTMYVKEHTINAYMTYHSSGEVIMWPWGWTGDGDPDSLLHFQVGSYMASQVECLGSGTYDYGPIYSAIYPVSGSSLDWFYSWSHWVGGVSALSFTTELGTTFYQPASDLDHMVHQNFKAMKYLAGFCDSIVYLLEGVVPPPEIYALGSVLPDFTVAWHPKNSDDNHPTHWQLVEFSNPSIVEDDLESGSGRYELEGFALSTARAHSGSYSFFSGYDDDMNHAVRAVHPYPVQSGDSVTFWCWYSLETDRDVAVVEVSENTKEWFNLDTTRFTGYSSAWIRRAYSLEDWVGRSVYIRFRAMTNEVTLGTYEGFYVDDIYPSCLFADLDTVSSYITDTLYAFTGHSLGDYFYAVRGYNSAWGWGDYSCLAPAHVVLGIAENGRPVQSDVFPLLAVLPNPFYERTTVSFGIGQSAGSAELRIYDAVGRMVKDLSSAIPHTALPMQVVWDGSDDAGRRVPSGVYFVRLSSGEATMIRKAVLIE